MDGLARAFALRLAGFDSFRCPQGICSILAFLFWLIFADLSWRYKEEWVYRPNDPKVVIPVSFWLWNGRLEFQPIL